MSGVLKIPELSLVVLVGPSGSGKSSFARKHFKPTEVLSSDFCRALVSDDENDQAATNPAFEVLHAIAARRLTLGRLTVVDATNVQAEARQPLVALAREHHVLPIAIVLGLPEKLCHERNRGRTDRAFGPHVIRQQHREMRRALKTLYREGFRYVHVLDSPEAVEAVNIERTRLWNDRRDDTGPFDIVGDVHGCFDALDQGAARGLEVQALADRYRTRADMIEKYIAAYRQYCWPVESLADLKLAPFHLLATEGKVHMDKDHGWHMEDLARIAQAAPDLLMATSHRIVDVTDEASQRTGIEWWEELTARGGEGAVVKPFDFIAKGTRGLLQPAIKCRGREYLRIIYGPEYTLPEHMERLRARGLNRKRSLALREFALGVEALERFVRREPLYRVHEAVFGVLALESEPVDPRL